MNASFTFVLGLLVGWLIEWLIDYFYWRRRYTDKEAGEVSHQVAGSRLSLGEAALSEPAAKPAADDLKIIKGIGPVIERMLNDAGIRTFEQLGKLTAGDLRKILGNTVERLADEESLLQQARELAGRK